ncbi:polysaccharide lyase family 8 super-sandwich domain-containing protein [Pseudomonas sp. NPDC089734]|uniref:polysaccharide lyase family 8 super-sandwich domain-containing protein n=1 Tax=Pseudomonas sp. NPDC089734 TaxID=3364469 RepID=UPI00382ABCF3
MESATDWISLGRITSDRDLTEGEKLQVRLIASETGDLIEIVLFSPPPDSLEQCAWPQRLAEHINLMATHIRAGVRQADGSFKAEFSHYLNELWVEGGTTARTFLTTACDLDGWSDLGVITSVGSLPSGTSITCRLSSKDHGDVYQTMMVPITDDQCDRYSWPAFLSHSINTASNLLRAGEKNTSSKTFVPVGSSGKNRLWGPSGFPLSAHYQVSVSSSALVSALSIYNALCAKVMVKPPTPQVIEGWLKGFADGKFQDLSYPASDIPVSDVTPLITHLERTLQIASYLYQQTSPLPVDYQVKALEALVFFAAQDYRTANWWYRNIGLAKLAGRAGLLLAKHVKQQELMGVFVPYAMRTTNTYSFTQTGANLADFASIQITWSLCAWKNSNEDTYLLYLRASADVLSELCLPVERNGVQHGEGISADFSISQHNVLHNDVYCSQLYSGTYGAELLGRIFESMAVLSKEFALTNAALSGLTKVVVNGNGWMGFARHLDFHVCGRAISRGVLMSSYYANWARALLPIADVENKQALSELIRRAEGDESNNQYYKGGRIFWVNDYMAHIGSRYCLWAKAISTRTVGGEGGIGENPKGYYMGAGTYFLTRHGKEYEGIQPVWDWQRLPGTTVEQVPDFTWPDIWGVNMWGSHDFSGGVSDGKRSLLSMELSRENVTHAYKTVMALDDHIVCIGTRINSTAATHPVVTSVNQCMLKGAVRYLDLKGQEHDVAVGQTITANDIHMVYHDGFVYRFGVLWGHPSVTIEVKVCSGAWSDINVGGSPDKVEYPVFSLWINHAQGENGSYLYEISVADDFPATRSVLAMTSATDDVHLWADIDNSLMASFFKPVPTLYNVDERECVFLPEQACSYIYRLEGTQFSLTCADSTQTRDKLSFIVEMDEAGNPLRRLEVSVPQGDDRGQAVSGVYPAGECVFS